MSVHLAHHRQADSVSRQNIGCQRSFETVDQSHRSMSRAIRQFGVADASHDAIAQCVVAKTIDPNFLHTDLLDNHENPRLCNNRECHPVVENRQPYFYERAATSLTQRFSVHLEHAPRSCVRAA